MRKGSGTAALNRNFFGAAPFLSFQSRISRVIRCIVQKRKLQLD